MILPNPQEEPKSEVLAVKVSLSLKKEFAREAADMQIDNSEQIRMLIESRHETIKLAKLTGFMVELPLEIRDFSTVLATQNQVSEPHFIACLLGKFMDSHKATLGFATYPILEQLVDQLQDIDIQRVTPVNGNVNAPVNGGLLPKTQENVGSVNAPKNIEEVILPIMVALKIPQLLRNVQSLINYPINEKRTFSRFNQDELSSILFYGFEDRSITQISEKFALLLDIQDKKWF